MTDPEIYMVAHPSAQVFAYARSRRRPRLFITEGAAELLSPAELEAVLTFELLSFDRSLPVLNYWVGSILDLQFRLGRALERGFAFVFGWAPPIAVWLIGPASMLMHFLLLSPADYQKLDKRTAAMLGNPENLARALWKMESYARTKPWRESWVFAHMCIVSPLPNLMRVQPPLKRRIKDLLGRYPL
jgi:hypothetical protein